MSTQESKKENQTKTKMFHLSNIFFWIENNISVIKLHMFFITAIVLLTISMIFTIKYNISDFKYLLLLFILFFLFIYKKAIQQEKNKIKDEKCLFGNTVKSIKKSDNFFINAFITFYILTIFVLPAIAFPIKLYHDNFGKNGISTKTQNWAFFGEYISGTVGVILALCAFMATLFLLFQQQKQIDITENSNNQKQFETTFFTLSQKLSECASENNMQQFYVLLKIICHETYQYTNINKIGMQKYIDILKTYINDDVLAKIFLDEKIFSCDTSNNNNLYVNIKNIIDKYSFFEYLNLYAINNIALSYNANYLNNKEKYFKKYKISAFEGNDELMPIRISLEENPDELKKYSTHPEKAVRKAVAKNKNTPIEILERLSKDEDEEVRQAAIDTINSLKSQNDENN